MITPQHRARIFQNPELHHAFERDGYVVLDFFSPAQIAEMQAFFEQTRPGGLKGFYTTTFEDSPDYRTRIDEGLRTIFAPSVAAHFERYKYFFSSFIVKSPDPRSELILHQDMSLVDEARFPGMNIWAPLVDLTMDNGPLYVLPGSHRLVPTYRGSSLPDVYDGIEKEVISLMTPLLLKAGQAVAFDQSIFHYSPSNRSDRERVVVNTFISAEEASIRICWHDKVNAPDKVELFAQADDFLRHYANFGKDIFQRPEIGESLGYVPYGFPKLTLAQLEAEYGRPEVGRLCAPSVFMPSPSILRNRDLQARLDEDGYVQVQLLQPDDVQALRALYAHYFTETPHAFHSSSYLADFDRKREMSHAIRALMQPRLDAVFHRFQCFGSAFLTKSPGGNSQMPVHQDWTIVDERQYLALNIWTPLQDTDAQNGGLQVLRGSHRYTPVMRCPTLPFFYLEYQAEVMANLTQLEAKAGEAVILNQALLHASPPNLSQAPRLAITTGIKTLGAPMQFHYVPEPGKLELFAMDEDFLLRFEDFHKDIYARPQFGESLGVVDFEQVPVDREVILAKIRASGPVVPVAVLPETVPGKPWWRRLFG